MITLSTADNALKSFYLDAVTEALNTKANPFLARIKKTTQGVVGKDVKKLVKVGISGGISAGSETGNLPTASPSDYILLTSTLKNLYGTIEISDKAIRASASNEGAFVNLLNDEMESLVKSASMSFGRMLFGDGTGKLATVKSIADGWINLDSVNSIEQGMILDVYSSAGEANAEYQGVKVIGINREKKSVLFDREATGELLPTGSKLYMQMSYGYEITGLEALFTQTDTLYGASRSHDALNPYVNSSVGALTVEKMEAAVDVLEERWSSKVNFVLCSPGVRRALTRAMRNASMEIKYYDLDGSKALDFRGVPVLADRYCPSNTMYLLNTDDFKLHQLCDWQWMEGEDGKILKQIAGKPVYTATLVKYAELMCEKPCGQGKLAGITEV